MLYDLIKQYIVSPEQYFGEGNRQAKKLHNATAAISKRYALTNDELMGLIYSAANLRLRYGEPTIYIKNIGSSGSHWLKSMLSHAFGFLGGGEIYIPSNYRKDVLKNLSLSEAQFLVQAIYLAHVYRDIPEVITHSITNTAHVANINAYSRYDIHSFKVLLIRNPVDIVLSRTYRKDEFRNYLGFKDQSDDDYLKVNVQKVESFYEKALKENHDFVCSYEDVVSKPKEVITQFAKVIGLQVDEKKIDEAVYRTTEQNSENKISTNKYDGEKKGLPDEIREKVDRKMRKTKRLLGYE